MRAVIYARYSSHNQTFQSIEGQLKECHAFAKRNDYKVIKEYIDEATTGTNDNRESFQEMIEDGVRGFFDAVIVYQLDRFARNRYDSAIHKKKLKDKNIRVLSARENITDDASGVLMESVLEGMAEYFSLELGQKVKRGMGINASKCLYNGGTVPLGLKLVEAPEHFTTRGDKEVKKYKFGIDEEKAPIIEKIFQKYLEGETYADIIRYLNDLGIKTAGGSKFGKSSIKSILENTRYYGIYSYGGVEVKGGIPQIIDDETFEKAQMKMDKKKKANAGDRLKANYILTTKLFCGHCKDMMTGDSGTSKTGKKYNYYACKNVKNKPATCNKKNVSKQYIEDLVVNKARELLTDENIIMIANEVVVRANNELENSNLKRLTKALKNKDKEKENLFAAIRLSENDILRKELLSNLESLEIERKMLEQEIKLEEENVIQITVPQVKFFLKEIRKGDANDDRYRRLLVDMFINSIYLYDDKITGIFNVGNKKFEVNINDIETSDSSVRGQDALPNVY